MKRLIAVLLCAAFLSVGCAESKRMASADCATIEPYGIFNQEDEDKRVSYRVSPGNVILSVIFIETLIVPVALVGWYLWEAKGTECGGVK